MACKLYIQSGSLDTYLGTFKNQEKAEAHYQLVRSKIESELGTKATPIYVETGKGRGKAWS